MVNLKSNRHFQRKMATNLHYQVTANQRLVVYKPPFFVSSRRSNSGQTASNMQTAEKKKYQLSLYLACTETRGLSSR